MDSPSLDDFTKQCAKAVSIIAWCLVAYTYFNYSSTVVISSQTHTVVPFNLFSVLALVTALISMGSALPRLKDEIAYPTTWLFVIWCSAPFIIIVSLLNPFGNYPG
jgi:hypothetical protein